MDLKTRLIVITALAKAVAALDGIKLIVSQDTVNDEGIDLITAELQEAIELLTPKDSP